MRSRLLNLVKSASPPLCIAATLLVISVGTIESAAEEKDKRIQRWFGASSKPIGPAQTFAAEDVALETRGATGKLEELLAKYDLPPKPFDYTLQPLAEEEAFTMYRLTFPSPVETQWPQNNVVPCEYYVPREAAAGAGAAAPGGAKRPAVVVLDILDGSAIIPRMLARAAAQRGVVALYVPMAGYNARSPGKSVRNKWIAEDPLRVGQEMRQTVLDVRRARAILLTRPEVDPGQIGITGVSSGGFMTALAAGVDGGFNRVVPILSGGNLVAIIFKSPEMRRLRVVMKDKGITEEGARAALAFVEPLHFASRIPRERVLMISAADDEVMPKGSYEALSEAMGGAEIAWVKAGHYSAALFLPVVQTRMIDFLGGRPVGDVEDQSPADEGSADAATTAEVVPVPQPAESSRQRSAALTW